MSYCALLAFSPEGLTTIEEYKNSHGWCAYVWGMLFDKYITKEDKYDYWLNKPQRLWDLVNDDRLSWTEIVVLRSTFDYALVKTKDVLALADLFDAFVEMYPPVNHVCHLPAMAKDLRTQILDIRDVVAVGWYGMSVGDNPWTTYSEEEDDDVEYDCDTGDKHFFVDVVEPEQVAFDWGKELPKKTGSYMVIMEDACRKGGEQFNVVDLVYTGLDDPPVRAMVHTPISMHKIPLNEIYWWWPVPIEFPAPPERRE